MLLHLPLAILTMLSPIAVSDTVPKFNIVRECSFEGGSAADFARCSRDEAAAFRQLHEAWSLYVAADRKACTAETTIGGAASYVELLTCLEMAGYGKNADNISRGPRAKPESRPTRPGPPEVTVGVGHDPTSSRSGR
jgi:hypothetical protein